MIETFHFITTDDGSPSLRLEQDASFSESMHSLKGAFSETFYIYGSALEFANEHQFPMRTLSMGLGLGYIELLAAAVAHKNAREFSGESFEIVPELREWFTAWLVGREIPQDFARVYDDIESRTSEKMGLPVGTAKSVLAKAVRTGQWVIREALEPATTFTAPFNVICFDAFSSKSTPDLWNEDFLKAFFAKAAATSCVLSTYACTGALKRSLRAADFDLRIREGFSSKRDSTFAVRGVSN